MNRNKIQQVFDYSYQKYTNHYAPSPVQERAAFSIMACKSGKLGCNINICPHCGHLETHNNSCRNRNCPCCQAVLKELWIDERKSEVIDAPYFHVVFTIPAELRPLILANQKILYSLLHDCSAKTLLELSADKKYLGATPGIIQVLHTWGQELNFHPHIHCIISGGGLTPGMQFAKSKAKFFIPVKVLGKVFRGKFLETLQKYYITNNLTLTPAIANLSNSYEWNFFRDSLYKKDWVPYIKETFNGFGNAIDYLGRYTHKIAISNSRILSVTEDFTTFTANDYRTGEKKKATLPNVEFIRRFLQHVLPKGFQKIRYYGFLNNRYKKKNLQLLFKLIGKQKFRALYSGMNMDQLLLEVWNINIHLCPECGCEGMRCAGRTFHNRN